MNAFKKSVELSTGDIIFFLDSDDYFHKDKIKNVINSFSEDSEKMIVFDYPVMIPNNKKFLIKKNNNIFKTYWGYIHPTSCISIRKKFIDKVFEATLSESFTNIWFDFRVLLFSKYLHNYNTINESLTYYRQTENNISSKFEKYRKNWWKRRNEAHDYFLYFIKNNNLKINKNLDFYITRLINIFI